MPRTGGVVLAAGWRETDLDPRGGIYQEIQAMILEEFPYIMLAYYTKPVVMSAAVRPGSSVKMGL